MKKLLQTFSILILSLLGVNANANLQRVVQREIKAACSRARNGAIMGIELNTFEDEWTAKIEALKEPQLKRVSEKIVTAQAHHSAINEELNRYTNGERLQMATINHEQERLMKLEAAERKQKQSLDSLEKTKQELGQAELNFRRETSKFDIAPSKKSFLNQRFAPIVNGIATSAIELPLISSAMSGYLDASDGFIALISAGYTVCTGFMCDLAGKDLAEKKTRAAAAPISTCVALMGGAFWMRHLVNNELLNPLNLISLAFLVAGIITAYKIHKYRPYWEAKEEFNSIGRKVRKAETTDQKNKKETDTIGKDVLNQAKQDVIKQLGTLNKDKNAAEIKLAEQKALADSTQRQFRQWDMEGIAKIRESYAHGKNLFQHGRGFGTACLLSACLSFSSCSNMKSEPITNETMVTLDVSESSERMYLDGAPKVKDYLKADFGLNDEKNLYNGFSLFTSVIDGSGVPIVRQIVLQPDNSFWIFRNKKRRLDEVKAKTAELDALIDSMYKTPSAPISSIHLNQCNQLQILKASTFSKNKKYIRLSDGIETSGLISFGQFVNDIPRFKKSFPAIEKKFDAACQMDLKGIEIALVCSPDYRTSELVIASNDFWKYYLEQKGAHVTVSGNLR